MSFWNVWVEALCACLDAAMIAGDVAVNRGLEPEEVLWSRIRVGSALWALNQPLDAAHVFEETIHTFWIADMRLSQALPNICAETYRHAGKYDRSEVMLLMALSNQSLQEETISDLMECLLHTYYATAETPGGVPTDMLLVVLSALLVASGFQQQSESERIRSILSPSRLPFIRRKYKKGGYAKHALMNALRSPDPEQFRASILSCHEPSAKLIFVPAPESRKHLIGSQQSFGRSKGLVVVAEGSKEEEEMDLLQFARESLRDLSGAITETISCANPECDAVEERQAGNFMKCPCKRVYYCQKSCQLDDWQEHKRTCKFHAAKKNKKERKQDEKE